MGNSKSITFKRFTTVLVLLIIVSWFGATATQAAESKSEVPTVVKKVTPSVVAIIGRPTSDDETWNNNRFNLAHGTGVIVKSNGVIVTNAHVVKDMKNIVVVTSEGKSYSGKTTNIDEESDLALVKIQAEGLPDATLAASGDIEVGEPVAAIGTPISFALRNSVTAGIVSGIDRSVNSGYQLIQTDAAINPGNSGGALVNMQGQVIGINTLKYTEFGVESLGFAIPIDTVKYVLEHFAAYGKVKRPYLGLELEESWEAVVGLPSSEGLRVAYVDPDSPAAKADIQQGDLFLSIAGTSVKTTVDYNEALKKLLPNQTVSVTLQTGGTKQITLGEAHSEETAAAEDEDGSDIDADRGKTRIGDSYFGWSMKYPAGLVKQNQSDDGDSVTFMDAKGEFMLNLDVESKQSNDLSASALLNKLAGQGGSDSILERQYVKQEEGPSYGKLVGKTGGAYIQVRAYLHDSRIYYLSLYVSEEEIYKSPFKQNSYNDLLNSFQLSFDKEDEALKDISVYSDGDTTYTNGYGLSLDLPSGWSSSYYGGDSTYSNEDFSQRISVDVSSASSGDTLKEWVGRELAEFESTYASDYREVGEMKEVTLAGTPAIEIGYSYTMGGEDERKNGYSIHMIKDKYKYEINISYDQDESADEIAKLIETITSSVHIDKELMDSELGFIQDLDELLDKNQTVAFKNEKYKYELDVPEIWSSYSFDFSDEDEEYVSFNFTGGSLTIDVDTKTSFEDAVKEEDEFQKTSTENDSEYKVTATNESLFGGASVKKYVVHYAHDDIPYQETLYIIRKNDLTYKVTLSINEAVRTEENEARLNKAFESLTFLK
jgi:serine protease Do